MRAFGWFSLNREKIAASTADYWIFVLVGFEHSTTDFVIITPSELLRRLDVIHYEKKKVCQTYLWITEKHKCWETRGLNRPDQMLIAQGKYKDKERDFSDYLNNWGPIKKINGV